MINLDSSSAISPWSVVPPDCRNCWEGGVGCARHIYCVKDVTSFVTKLVEYSILYILAVINIDRWLAKPAGHTDSQNLYPGVQIVYCVQIPTWEGGGGGEGEKRGRKGIGGYGRGGGRLFTCGAETVKNKWLSIKTLHTDRPFKWCGKVWVHMLWL